MSEVCKPRICDRLICADYIPEAAPDPDIVVSKGSVSNDNTGGEGSGLGDVGNEVFADDDIDDFFSGDVSGGENFLRS